MDQAHRDDQVEPGVGAPRLCRVIAAYTRAYADPIRIRAGESVTLTGREDNWQGWIWIWAISGAGKAGWMPQAAVERRGEQTVARYDYDARELSVGAGDPVTVERAASGWLWCVAAAGRSGWVPADHIACP